MLTVSGYYEATSLSGARGGYRVEGHVGVIAIERRINILDLLCSFASFWRKIVL